MEYAAHAMREKPGISVRGRTGQSQEELYRSLLRDLRHYTERRSEEEGWVIPTFEGNPAGRTTWHVFDPDHPNVQINPEFGGETRDPQTGRMKRVLVGQRVPFGQPGVLGRISVTYGEERPRTEYTETDRLASRLADFPSAWHGPREVSTPQYAIFVDMKGGGYEERDRLLAFLNGSAVPVTAPD